MTSDQAYSLIFAMRDLRTSVKTINERLKEQEILLEKKLKIEEEILKILREIKK